MGKSQYLSLPQILSVPPRQQLERIAFQNTSYFIISPDAFAYMSYIRKRRVFCTHTNNAIKLITVDLSVSPGCSVNQKFIRRISIMPWFVEEGNLPQEKILELTQRAADEALSRICSKPSRVLLLPPDITRAHSGAGKITEALYNFFSAFADVHLIPTLGQHVPCLLYTSPSPRDLSTSRMPSSA
eukprot:TRINITY_DN5560_c0_g1_i1.p1 TRINITY_DN5560_c0_g1~~TRINITY_DN5560_c0_g1_i1.p1  ORF type:complete len:185 (+),score=9.35 TRINITY_DN5560_c0_g1_i1:578-1132(+)